MPACRYPRRVSIRDALTSELARSMRQRDRAVAAALRMAIGELDNAEALPVGPGGAQTPAHAGSEHVAGAAHGLGATEAARVVLSDADQRTIVAAERTAMLAHAERLARLCRYDEADGARRAAGALAAALEADGPTGS